MSDLSQFDESERQKLMKLYLIGGLPEKERSELEELYAFHQETLIELICVENDMIDAYVKYECGPEEIAQIERVYLAAPDRRKRVEFARLLAAYTRNSSSRRV